MRPGLLLIALAATAPLAAQGIDDLPDRPIPRSEVAAVVKRQFAAMDRNRDRVVTPAEFEASRAAQESAASSPYAAFDRIGRRWFERADTDGDGRVTLREATERPLGLFDMADTNGDSVVSVEEKRLASLLMSFGR